MQVLARGIAVASRPMTDLSNCLFPCICVLETGRWLLGVRTGPAKNSRCSYVVMSYSDDAGKTWSDPAEPCPTPPHTAKERWAWRAAYPTPLAGNRVLLTLAAVSVARPFLPMYNESTQGLMDFKVYLADSRDGGKTFSKPRPAPCKPFTRVPTPLTGPTMVLANGHWLLPFEVNKHYADLTPWQHYSAAVPSRDRGKTWGKAVVTHTDPHRRIFCWDQRTAVLPDQRLMALYWTFDQPAAAYRNIHLADSRDHGKTWSAPRDTGVPGQPARPVGLSGNRVVMVYIDRTKTPTIKARLSHDGGQSFPADTELEIDCPLNRAQERSKGGMNDAWSEMAAFSVGLPDAVALPNGDVLLVYYSGPHPDQTNIHWARLRV